LPQRLAIDILLQGGYMVDNTGYGIGYRVYDAKGNVLLKLNEGSYKKISSLLRKQKLKLLIDKNKLRQLRKNSWIKQQYYSYQRQQILKAKKHDQNHQIKNEPAPVRCVEYSVATVHPTLCIQQQ
jgi:hypothetical protein